MNIISWNVAGWATTIDRIKAKHGTVSAWMEKSRIDILCIQEVKMSMQDVCDKVRESGVNCEKDYDFFFAFNKPLPGGQRLGLNGVATFVRKGMTLGANAKVLNDNMLDTEGRCLMTDHGEFVLFNVYIPYSGQGYCRLPYKMKFLNKLRTIMQTYRNQGKKVILAGDLNIAPRPVDCAKEMRKVNLNDVLHKSVGQLLDLTDENLVRRFEAIRSQLHSSWENIRDSLQNTLELEVQEDLVNKKTKYCMKAVRSDGRIVRLGKTSVQKPMYEYCLEEIRIPTSNERDNPTDGEYVVARSACTLSVGDWKEVFSKLSWPPSNLTGSDWDFLADVCGTSSHTAVTISWLESLLREDNMVNSFEEAHPQALCRFTCWDQSTNRRYSNEGTRLDHIILDRDMWEEGGLVGGALPGYENSGINNFNLQYEREAFASLVACTANGMFKAAGFGMQGIPDDAPAAAYEYQFISGCCTGIIYTPPDFSDHVAVSLLLSSRYRATSALPLAQDSNTKSTQPHLRQASITSFFISKTASSLSCSGTAVSVTPKAAETPADTREEQPYVKPNPVIDFFGPRKPKSTVSNSDATDNGLKRNKGEGSGNCKRLKSAR